MMEILRNVKAILLDLLWAVATSANGPTLTDLAQLARLPDRQHDRWCGSC